MRTGRSLTVCWSLLEGCFPGGGCFWRVCFWGVCFLGGVPLGGVLPKRGGASGGCASGVCASWGGVLPRGCASGGCASRGVCLRGVWYPSMHWGRPPCEQKDRQVQKYYLGHNFFAAGNKIFHFLPFMFKKQKYFQVVSLKGHYSCRTEEDLIQVGNG